MMKAFKLKLVILVILLLVAAFSVYAASREDRGGILTVAFLDIGQGDAIFIDTPSGNQMLIDGGPGKSVLRELSKVMPFYDRSIDVVIATHADQDHVGGLPNVLKNYKVNIFMEPGLSGPSSSYEELEKMVERLDTPTQGRGADQSVGFKKILARRGMVVDLGDGAILQILFPVIDPPGTNTNMSSIVAKLVYGENEFMLTGDSPIAIEDYLVSLGGLKSDVLKAGHHGSKTSSSDEFVRAVAPQYTVISAGKNNRYGHPHQEVLDILNNFGTKILFTFELGQIVFKSDGINLELK